MSTQNLITNFTKHPVFKAMSIYLVVAWLILQVAATIFPIFELSNNWLKGLVGLLFIGLLATFVLSFSKSSQNESIRNYRSLSVSLIVLLFLAFGLGLGLLLNRSFRQDTLSEVRKNERVAVLFLENETGNTSLNGLGSYFATNLTESFREINVKTLGSSSVRQAMKYANYYPGNIENQISFTEATGAALTVNGSIYSKQDSILIIQSRLTDAYTGEDIVFFPEVKGTITDLEDLSRSWKNKILGYWVNKEDIEKGKFKTPNYEAYLAFEKAEENFWNYEISIPLYKKAIALDSNFFVSYVPLSIAYGNKSRIKERKTLLDQLVSKRALLTPYEQLLLDRELAWSGKDLEAYHDKSMEAFHLAPKDFTANFFAGFASCITGRYYQAIEVFEHMDDRTIPYIGHLGNQTRLRNFAGAYIATGQPQKALDLLEKWMPESDAITALWANRVRALVQLGKQRELEELIDQYQDISIAKISGDIALTQMAARQYFLIDELDLAHQYAKRTIERPTSEGITTKRWYRNMYFILGQWNELYQVTQSMLEKEPDNPTNLSVLAIATMRQAEVNSSKKVNRIIETLKQMDLSDIETGGIAFPSALRDVALAAIHAHMNEPDEAIGYLKKAIDKNYNPMVLQNQLRLRPLANHPQMIEWSTAKE